MDPKACWERLVDALSSGDLPEAQWAAHDLQHWLSKGGNSDGLPEGLRACHLRDFIGVLNCVRGKSGVLFSTPAEE